MIYELQKLSLVEVTSRRKVEKKTTIQPGDIIALAPGGEKTVIIRSGKKLLFKSDHGLRDFFSYPPTVIGAKYTLLGAVMLLAAGMGRDVEETKLDGFLEAYEII